MARALLVLAAALLRPTSGGNSTSGTTHPSCLNSAGEAVDYWVALKLPNGAITYESYGGALKKSASGMDGTSGNLIVNTVQQIYKMKDSSAVGVALYNDETDAGVESASHAHSKGVVAFDTTQGFWLVHSLPRYPNHRSKGYGPLPTVTYGQSWLCMTLKTATFEDVGTQLQVTGPLFYDTHLSSTLTTKLPAFAAAIAGTTSGVATSTKTIHTKGGAVFYHLAKSKAWGKELYDDLVAPKCVSSSSSSSSSSMLNTRGIYLCLPPTTLTLSLSLSLSLSLFHTLSLSLSLSLSLFLFLSSQIRRPLR